MIARIWTGQVAADAANEYIRLMRDIALPDYRSTDGNQGAWCLHRREGEVVTVTMFTLWKDIDSIRGFAGNPVTAAKYYDFDPQFLIEMSPSVDHFDVEA